MGLSQMPKLGFRAKEAAVYLGLSETKFHQLVQEDRIPKGRRIDGCVIWRADELYQAFLDLLDEPKNQGQSLDQKLGLV